MADLTIIYLTVNKMPKRWVDFHMKHLLQAIGDYPVVSVSRLPMDFGTNLIQTGPFSGWNVYCQMLRAARVADTAYIAIAEDDTLYTRKHFEFRPDRDCAAYDLSRWNLYVWDREPSFSCVRRHGNFTLIASTDLVIEALSERMAKHPNGSHMAGEIGRSDVEHNLGVTRRKIVEWWCRDPIVTLGHQFGLSFVRVPGMRRKRGELKAFEIPYWGRAKDIVAVFNEGLKEEAHA